MRAKPLEEFLKEMKQEGSPMKFTKKQFVTKYHIFAKGYGKDVEIVLQKSSLHRDSIFDEFTIEQAEQFLQYFTDAIEMAKSRLNMKKDETEEDDE